MTYDQGYENHINNLQKGLKNNNIKLSYKN